MLLILFLNVILLFLVRKTFNILFFSLSRYKSLPTLESLLILKISQSLSKIRKVSFVIMMIFTNKY